MAITARYTVIVMLSLALMNLYSFRSVTVMIRPYLITVVGGDSKRNVSTHVCPSTEQKEAIKPLTNITEPMRQQHVMKLGYDCARALAHVLSGFSCDRTGGRYIVLFSLAGGATLITLYPTLLLNSPTWGMMIYLIVTGSFSGYAMPAFMSLIASWSPHNRKTVFVGSVYAGGAVTKVMEYLIIEYFTVIHHQWESVFFVFAILGYVCCFVYMYTVFSKPGMHPLISSTERLFLEMELGTKVPTRIPWRAIVTDGNVAAILFGKFAHLWVQNINQNYLPAYFTSILRINLRTKGGFHLILPHILLFACTITSAVLVQRAVNRNTIQLTQLRIFCTMFGAVVPPVLMLLMSYAECNILAHLLGFVAICSMATMNLGVKSNILDLTSHFAGFCEAFVNGVATLGVMALPRLMATIVTENNMYEWRRFYWITLAFTSFLGTMHYLFVGSDRAKWDHLKDGDYIAYDEEFLETAV